jgi:hypothetical protein
MRAEADEVTGRDRVQLGLDLQGVNEEPNGTTARRSVKAAAKTVCSKEMRQLHTQRQRKASRKHAADVVLGERDGRRGRCGTLSRLLLPGRSLVTCSAKYFDRHVAAAASPISLSRFRRLTAAYNAQSVYSIYSPYTSSAVSSLRVFRMP